MKSSLFSTTIFTFSTTTTTTTCCCLLLSLTQIIAIAGQSVFVRQAQQHNAAIPVLNYHRPSSQQHQHHPSSSSATAAADLQTEESGALGLYPGGVGGLSGYGHNGGGGLGGYGMPIHTGGTYGSAYGSGLSGGIGGGLSSGSYDDLHKYGGIGKKAHTSSLYDHGSKGYKDYYGDTAYGNQGLNKYNNQHSSDNTGSSKGNHANYHGGHVYTRNRGYGYEKSYMYDKEFSTAKSGGSKGGHHSYYGDHKKGGQSSVKAFKNYGGKKYGAKKGHDEHAYGKYGHLMDDHGEHYLKAKAGLGKVALMPHLEHSSYSSGDHGGGGGYMGGHNEYMPVIESYGGALGHGRIPVWSTLVVKRVENGGGSSAEQVDEVEPPPPMGKHISISSTSSPIMNSNSSPLISTKMGSAASSLGTPPMYATIGSAFNHHGTSRGGGGGLVNSAVHATPAVISTSSGAHYYNS
ncbi:hypothetical protein TYRP_006699 [Tyrophagus putrescentiae]|nr:hypothetical protein TYRP_006699 [Tyrophagus putrescentiae]